MDDILEIAEMLTDDDRTFTLGEISNESARRR